MANKKYSKFLDPDLEVKTFRWPYWLLPLLFLSLLLVLGLFIFITIHSTDSFGCFFHCEQKIDNGGLRPPDLEHQRQQENISATVMPTQHVKREEKTTVNSTTSLPQHKKAEGVKKGEIVVYGKIFFPKDRVPKALPSNSHLKVDFEDAGLADASSNIIASTEVDLSLYPVVKYEIKCSRPRAHDFYSVNAVLNMGWKADENNWIKKGDYHTDTSHMFEITDKKTKFEVDIQLAYYN